MSISDAFIAAVRAALADWPQVKVYDSIVLGDTPNQYVAVYPDPGERTGEDLDFTYDTVHFTAQVTSVAAGTDRDLGWDCRGLATKVRDALVGQVLDVPGWSCDPIEHDFSQKPQKDEDVLELPTVFKPDGYKLTAIRVS